MQDMNKTKNIFSTLSGILEIQNNLKEVRNEKL